MLPSNPLTVTPPPPKTPIPSPLSSSDLLSLLSNSTLPLSQAKSIHTLLLKHPHHPSILLLKLHSLYPPSLSTPLILSHPKPSLLSFNLLISSLSSSHPSLSLLLLTQLLSSPSPSLFPDQFTLPSSLSAATSLRSLPLTLSLHAFSLKTRLSDDPFVASALINAYSSCSRPALALRVLTQLPNPDLPTYNSALTGLSKHGDYHSALRVFVRSRNEGLHPNRTTLSSTLTACGRLANKKLGGAIHSIAVKLGEETTSDVSVNSSLVFMYAKFGDLDLAGFVFRLMPERNVVSWNTLISGHAQNGEEIEAWELFVEMLAEGIAASEVTLTSVMTVAAKLVEGRMMHGIVIKVGLIEDEIIGAAIVDMYVRLGNLIDAQKYFDQMERNEMGSWNSLILGYSRNGHPREALKLFNRLREHKSLCPNSITLVGALNACASLCAIKEGRMIHDYIVSNGIHIDLILGTSLIDMYSKCGCVEKAWELFQGMKRKDLVAWSAMISGYGINGQVKEAMEVFDRMVNDNKMKPDNATFTSILSACSHAGKVQEGWDYFNAMQNIHNLKPKNEQYACMVDLLGRAGKLEEAHRFIDEMPIQPNASVWGALLGACRIHKNTDLGAYAAKKLFALNPQDAGYYVLLSNLYAATGRWDDAKRVREMMKSKGLHKPPGCSWTYFNGRMHEFFVEDKAHPQSEKIYKMLDELGKRMKVLGYIADTDLVLHDVDDEVKEGKLSSHSERLAIAFALINTTASEPIRVTKNLRVCSDCHRVTKLISKITERKIIVRDARRFHHFEGGECSCGDYW